MSLNLAVEHEQMNAENTRRAGSARPMPGRRPSAPLLVFILSAHSLLNASEHHGEVTFGGVPVPGATVTATRGEKRIASITDALGVYTFTDMPDGVWTIRVEMAGFATLEGNSSISRWELKMLQLSEIRADVAHNEWVVPKAGVASEVAFPKTAPVEIPPNTATGAFTNLNPQDLNQRAMDELFVFGSATPTAPIARPLGDSGVPAVLAHQLYYANIGIVPSFSALDARSFSLTGRNTPKPAYRRQTAFVNLGGPLIPHKDDAPVLFVRYERILSPDVKTAAGRMPTAAERDGDFTHSMGPLGQPFEIVDPSTGLPFVGDVIPKSRISSQARSLLTFFPLPNSDGSAPYNYQIPIVNITRQDNLQARLNESFDTKNQLVASVDLQSARSGDTSLFNFLDKTRTFSFNTAISWMIRPSRGFSATFRYQFSRLETRTTPYFATHLDVSGLAGINGNNREPANWGPPNLIFSGGTSSLSEAQYAFNRSQTHSISYSSFLNRGRHNVTVSGGVRRQQSNFLSQQDARGTFTFTGATGSDLADFILGIPATSSIAFGNADKYLRQTVYNVFVSDDWKMNDVFTLNFGGRWDYEAPITELYGRLVNLNITPEFLTVVPVVGNAFVQPDRAGFQPRVSFAWRPITASSLILRVGYGLYRNTNVYQPIANELAQQPPLSTTLRLDSTPSNPLTLANGFLAVPGMTANTFAVDPHFRVSYAQIWTLSLQHDLPAAIQMTVTYMGTKGTRLPQESLPNTFPTGALAPAGYIYLTSNGNSTREAGLFQLRRRMRSGFTATVEYTYSKALDDAPLMAGAQVSTASEGGPLIAQNWLDLRAERALSDFDQKHRVAIQGQYSTGVGIKGGTLLTGWMGAALKEWTFVASLNIGSGLPETPVYFAALSGTGVTGTLRPDATGAPIQDAPTGLFVNPAAFRPPRSGQWGNASRNSITGPSQFSLNASLVRTFRLGWFGIELRMNVMNVLNHVTFKSWNTTVNNVQFGLPNGTNAMRSIQPELRVRF